MSVRPPAVAGLFYPDDPVTLRRDITRLLDGVEPHPFGRAAIVPHAGYVYSGSTAALVYAGLPDAGRILLLGPVHRVATRGCAASSADAYATPLGSVPVDLPMRHALLTAGVVRTDDAPHVPEHSLEVQMPFLQVVAPEAHVLPIAVGDASPDAVAAVIRTALETDPDTLILASSDLSHYHPYEEARRLDAGTLDQITGLAGPLDHRQACGATPVNGLLVAATEFGWHATVLGACNSGDTAGDKRRVVGYAAVTFDD